MKKPQFTVSPEGVTIINPDGVVVLDHMATPNHEAYKQKPVKVALHRDLTLQLHGANFSACAKLTASDALGLACLLVHLARERLPASDA